MKLLKSSSSYILHKQEVTRIQMRLLKIPQKGNSAHSNAVTKNSMTVISQIIANNKTWDYTVTS